MSEDGARASAHHSEARTAIFTTSGSSGEHQSSDRGDDAGLWYLRQRQHLVEGLQPSGSQCYHVSVECRIHISVWRASGEQPAGSAIPYPGGLPTAAGRISMEERIWIFPDPANRVTSKPRRRRHHRRVNRPTRESRSIQPQQKLCEGKRASLGEYTDHMSPIKRARSTSERSSYSARENRSILGSASARFKDQ